MEGAVVRRVPLVHAVTNDAILASDRFPSLARGVMRALGGRGALHLRSRRLSSRALWQLAVDLRPDADASGCRIVVNDRVDIALAAACWGVQLGSRSMRPHDARSSIDAAAALAAPRSPAAPRPAGAIALPDPPAATRAALAIGASVHRVEEAAALAHGVDWLIAGHVFESSSHPGAPPAGLQLLAAVVAAAGGTSGTSVIAIGGIVPACVGEVLNAGAHGIAAVTGIWSASDAGAAASDYLFAYDYASDSGRNQQPRGQRREP